MFTVFTFLQYLSDQNLLQFHAIHKDTFLVNLTYLLSLEYWSPSRMLDSFAQCNVVYKRIISSLASNIDPRYTGAANGQYRRIVHGSHACSNESHFVHETELGVVAVLECRSERVLLMWMCTSSRVSALESETQLANDGSAAVEREDSMRGDSFQN